MLSGRARGWKRYLEETNVDRMKEEKNAGFLAVTCFSFERAGKGCLWAFVRLLGQLDGARVRCIWKAHARGVVRGSAPWFADLFLLIS